MSNPIFRLCSVNGSAQSAGEHHIIVETTARTVVVRHPVGADTDLTVSIPGDGAPSDAIGVTGFDGKGKALGALPFSLNGKTAKFRYAAQLETGVVDRHESSDLPQLSTVSAASFTAGAPVAAVSIVAGFGRGLAPTTALAPQVPPLPTSLAGTSVTVKDSSQTERLAPLWFVSAGQVNYLAPAGTKPGLATVTVANRDQVMATGTLQVDAVAPGLFSANADGQGVAAAYALWANGTRPWQYIFQRGSTRGSCVSIPLDPGTATEQMYLVLYGTGIRGRSSLAAVTAKVGGVDTPVEYAGPVDGMVGLDQINLRVPRGLAGSGEVNIVPTADGKVGNTVKVNIQ